jgi:hypothetical protein
VTDPLATSRVLRRQDFAAAISVLTVSAVLWVTMGVHAWSVLPASALVLVSLFDAIRRHRHATRTTSTRWAITFAPLVRITRHRR